MSRSNSKRANLVRALGFTALTAFAATGTATFAQAPTERAVDDNDGRDDNIVVTGSRIAHPEMRSVAPIQVLSEEDIQRSGQPVIGNLLSELPATGAPLVNAANSNNTPLNVGLNFVNLRNLGQTRTLTLVNGRRHVPSDVAGGAVDLNDIPSGLIERIEVVTGGASAVYGSDAIAGVVNLILKSDFEGIDASLQYGISSRGDNREVDANLTVGGNFAGGRGNAVLSVNYFDNNGIWKRDRRISRVPGGQITNPANTSTSDGIPATIFSPLNFGGSTVLPEGIIRAFVVTNPQTGATSVQNLTLGNSLVFGAQGGPLRTFRDPDDRYNLNSDDYLSVPVDRLVVSGNAHYELLPEGGDFLNSARVFLEGTFASVDAVSQQAPEQLLSLQIPVTNPFLTPDIRALFPANTTAIRIDKRFTETGPRVSRVNREVRRVALGLEGQLSNGYAYEFYYQYGAVDVLAERNLIRPSQVQALLGTADFFGINQLTPEQVRQISYVDRNRIEISQQVAAASLSGNLLRLPAGNVQFALGAEYREERSDFQPDSQRLIGDSSGGAATRTTGGFTSREAYGELVVPILSDMFLAQHLAIEGAVRYSDFNTIGDFFTYKIGAEWSPFAGIRFRGVYQRAYRAPNVTELFAGVLVTTFQLNDPCDRGGSTPVRIANCSAEGITSAFRQENTTVPGAQGSNPDLTEERSDSFSAGAVFTPSFLPGFSASIDYWDIKINNEVSRPAPRVYLDLCYDTPGQPFDFCRSNAFVRDPVTKQLIFASSQQRNLAVHHTSGIDFQAFYRLPLSRLGLAENGSLDLSVSGTWVERIDVARATTVPFSELGSAGSPKWRLRFQAAYEQGPFDLALTVRYVGPVLIINTASPEAAEGREIGSVTYADLSMAFELAHNFSFFGGVRNMFDRDPPLFRFSAQANTNTYPTGYDIIGRQLYVGARVRF